jgi:peptidyl-prolyl cis-trans isomerase A (cyclophilin A)
MKQSMLAVPLALIFLLVWSGVAHSQTGELGKSVSPVEGAIAENPQVLMKTSMGEIHIELFRDKAPITVENFLRYTADKFYDGTIFHRVIPGFAIQGGGFSADLVRKQGGNPIQNEANNGLSNLRGTVSMARMQNPHSARTQFFISVLDNQHLDYFDEETWGYCVFGEVVKGMDVVDLIRDVRTGRKEPLLSDVPLETILIESITLIEQ